MFCPKCGQQCADDVRFCNRCGYPFAPQNNNPAPQVNIPAAPESTTQLPPQSQPAPVPSQEPVQQPAPQQAFTPPPVQQPIAPPPAQQPNYQPYYPQQPQPAPGKSGSFFDKFKPKTLIWITLLLSLVFLAASAYNMLSADLFDLPVLSLVSDMMDEDIESLRREAEWEVYEARNDYEMKKDNLTRRGRIVIEASLDAGEDFLDEPSLLNLRAFAEALEDEDDEIGVESIYIAGINVTEDPVDMVDTLILIMLGICYLLPLLFTLLGGLLRSKVQTITAIVFTSLIHIALGSWLWLFLLLAVYIAQIVFITQAKHFRKAA